MAQATEDVRRIIKKETLSLRDYHVLGVLFNKEIAGVAADNSIIQVPEEAEKVIEEDEDGVKRFFYPSTGILVDYSLPPDKHIDDKLATEFSKIEKTVLKNLDEDILKISNDKEIENKFKAKGKALEVAEDALITKIITSKFDGVNYASVYNNIGQIRRIKLFLMIDHASDFHGNELTLKDIDFEEQQIWSLIKKSIKLALPKKIEIAWGNDNDIIQDPELLLDKTINYKISKMQATVLSAAYSQLGSMLIVKAARLEKIYNQEKSKISKEENDKFLKEISDIERMASQYLYISGAFGNSMAAENAQGLNPYSKLCGNMVRESLLNDILGKS